MANADELADVRRELSASQQAHQLVLHEISVLKASLASVMERLGHVEQRPALTQDESESLALLGGERSLPQDLGPTVPKALITLTSRIAILQDQSHHSLQSRLSGTEATLLRTRDTLHAIQQAPNVTPSELAVLDQRQRRLHRLGDVLRLLGSEIVLMTSRHRLFAAESRWRMRMNLLMCVVS